MENKQIQDFPSLSEVQDEVEKAGEARSHSKRPWTRPVTIALAILAVILAVIDFFPKGTPAYASGTGGVSGRVVNQSLTPVPAEVYLLTTEKVTTAGSDGTFTLGDVPEGQQQLMVSYGGVGNSTIVTIEHGKMVDVGQIRVQETLLPPGQ